MKPWRSSARLPSRGHSRPTRRAQAIITDKLGRLARSTLQAATLFAAAKQEGWDLVIADIDTSTADGRFMRNVMAAAAEYEHELISVRTRDALAAAKARGIHVGRPRDVAPELAQAIVTAVPPGTPRLSPTSSTARTVA